MHDHDPYDDAEKSAEYYDRLAIEHEARGDRTGAAAARTEAAIRRMQDAQQPQIPQEWSSAPPDPEDPGHAHVRVRRWARDDDGRAR